MTQNQETDELSLQELWDILVDKEDITITVDIGKVEYIRRGLAKVKHREKEKFGEFADNDQKFRSYPLPQTPEEESDNLCRVRLVLLTKEGFSVHNLQVNDVDDLSGTG